MLDKTFTSVIVDFPPGARAAPHRHGEAFVYAYALEGTVRSQLDDKPVSTFHPGQNWVEQPGGQQVLTENTSLMERARLLVVFVADTGAELKVADPRGNRVTQRAATSTHTLTAPARTHTTGHHDAPELNLMAPTIKGFRVDEGSIRICSQA